jgi:hypothetical protein
MLSADTVHLRTENPVPDIVGPAVSSSGHFHFIHQVC